MILKKNLLTQILGFTILLLFGSTSLITGENKLRAMTTWRVCSRQVP